jgi:hypothetical protein
MGERDGRDLAFFFDSVHIHAEAELVVAVGRVSFKYDGRRFRECECSDEKEEKKEKEDM